MKYGNIFEEEIKNKVTRDFFPNVDCTRILNKIDFAVKLPNEEVYLLWAEAKQKPSDILVMLAQLVLTVGKARTFDEILPPPFLGCYDSEKIAFVPYHEIQDIFYQNDFNWNVAPSNHDTKEFRQVYNQIKSIINNDIPWETYLFYFEKDDTELRRFIRDNFMVGKHETAKTKVDKNNFIIIYSKWLDTVKPTIAVNWDIAKKNGIIDGDFYLADLLSRGNTTLKESLFVLLKSNYYETNRHIDPSGLFTSSRVEFTGNQKAHTQFWAKYARPPHEDYWDYIVERRDLLVPQDVRERKGSFFTPKIWVELSQRYLADVLGNDWQDEYYVWDCAAGTGNLLAGLTNKYNLWASTLDKQDVDVMHDRIKNGANLLESHVFQFDFLNDDFSKLPQGLQDIINDEKERKKLLIYINPPYAEAGSTVRRNSKTGVSNETFAHKKYCATMGMYAKRELFAQFIARIYCEIPNCRIAQFSKLKILQSPYFSEFRNFFRAKLEKFFLIPADTFDNVNGQFPIGFFIWNTAIKKVFKSGIADTYDRENRFFKKKTIFSYGNLKNLNEWLRPTWTESKDMLAYLVCNSNDFQHQNEVVVQSNRNNATSTFYKPIMLDNLIMSCIYFAVRKVIPADWLNDRDQFLFPNKNWEKDTEFHNNCLAYTLFHAQNRISSKDAVNHWIPFTESEVGAQDKFASHFMVSFLSGKIIRNAYTDLFEQQEKTLVKREFSPEAQAVFDAGRELWKYYHSKKNVNVNASLYDIKEYFQGRNDKGKMNNKSTDERYNELIGNLRETLKILAAKIEPKVYEHEFLKR